MKLIFAIFASIIAMGHALAADLPVAPPRAPAAYVPAVPPVYNWSGFYIGGNAGAAWNRGSVSDSNGVGFTLPSNNAVFTGGGQIGGNWQIGSLLVLGVEGQFDWLANQNNASAGIAVPPSGDIIQVISKDRWLTTLTGRVGIAADRWLVYAKGGGAWVGNQSFTVNDVTTGASFSSSNGGWNSGWTWGGGFEWAFAGTWSLKLEYDFIQLSSNSFTIPTPSPVPALAAGDTFTTSNRHIQMGLAGINYKFGPWW